MVCPIFGGEPLGHDAVYLGFLHVNLIHRVQEASMEEPTENKNLLPANFHRVTLNSGEIQAIFFSHGPLQVIRRPLGFFFLFANLDDVVEASKTVICSHKGLVYHPITVHNEFKLVDTRIQL